MTCSAKKKKKNQQANKCISRIYYTSTEFRIKSRHNNYNHISLKLHHTVQMGYTNTKQLLNFVYEVWRGTVKISYQAVMGKGKRIYCIISIEQSSLSISLIPVSLTPVLSTSQTQSHTENAIPLKISPNLGHWMGLTRLKIEHEISSITTAAAAAGFFPRVRGFWENVRQFVPRLRVFFFLSRD